MRTNTVGDFTGTMPVAAADFCSAHNGVADWSDPLVTCYDGRVCNSSTGICKSLNESTQPAADACLSQAGMKWDDVLLACVVDAASPNLPNAIGDCNAAAGMHWDDVQGCIPDQPCNLGGCAGTVLNGKCVFSDPACIPQTGGDDIEKQRCESASGMRWDSATGACMPTIKQGGGFSPGGGTLNSPVSKESECVQKGGSWVNGVCVSKDATLDTDTPALCAGRGGTWKNNQCIEAESSGSNTLLVVGGLSAAALLLFLATRKEDRSKKGSKR